jgi:hypothetical protein
MELRTRDAKDEVALAQLGAAVILLIAALGGAVAMAACRASDVGRSAPPIELVV